MKPSILKPNETRKRPKRLLAVITYAKDNFQTIEKEREFLAALLSMSQRRPKSIEIRHASWGEVGKLKFKGDKLGNTGNTSLNKKKPSDNLNRHFDLSILKPKKLKW